MEHMVKARLSVISDNCGGRVGTISRNNGNKTAKCVISFPSADDADRYASLMSFLYQFIILKTKASYKILGS